MSTNNANPSIPTKKKKNASPESQFFTSLTKCSKSKDLDAAISLYDSAISQKIRLNLQNFNTLLFIASNAAVQNPDSRDSAIEFGFKIYNQMKLENVNANEASITAIARLAAAKGDGDYAFELAKQLGAPKLRSYHPALFCFCENLIAEKAYEVEEHMGRVGLSVEEPELAALLRVSVEAGRGDRVYGYLHKLRERVWCVTESTAKVIEDWFCGEWVGEVGDLGRDDGGVKDAVVRNGGGWHGLGWIGSGQWSVKRGNVDTSGKCCCGERLACVDIDENETERFAESIAGLALEREAVANFKEFQDWLDKNAVYEAIVDGANVGLYQQNFADGGFSLSQLDAVVRELYNRSGKWPLVILHQKRIRPLLQNPSHRKIVEEWKAKGVIYTTPHGSNDDWYWLYAAVKLKCLLVTNDEMRDHIFELLGSNFFVKWKERHQVHYTFVKGSLKLQLPPPYSVVIQESDKGSWHVPISFDDCEESARSWLCITRPTVLEASNQLDMGKSVNCHTGSSNHIPRCSFLSVLDKNSSELHQNGDSIMKFDNDYTDITGNKRKERSPSPHPQ